MKKKLIDNVKIIIIILIGVTILFAILGAFNISTKENMSNSDYQSDDAPQCYPDAVVSEDDNSGYSSYNQDHNDDMYILKTKIVPPKGTACPSKISDPASSYLNGIGASAVAIGGVAESNSSQSESSSFMSVTTPQTEQKKETEKKTNSEPEPANTNTKHTEVLNETKGTISQTNQPSKSNSESCPPCPACERCPEPAFECKKVPNYRSPSIGQYMPMPILNDFSKF